MQYKCDNVNSWWRLDIGGKGSKQDRFVVSWPTKTNSSQSYYCIRENHSSCDHVWGPFDIKFVKDEKINLGILWVGYLREAGGVAIADVTFGSYNIGNV